MLRCAEEPLGPRWECHSHFFTFFLFHTFFILNFCLLTSPPCACWGVLRGAGNATLTWLCFCLISLVLDKPASFRFCTNTETGMLVFDPILCPTHISIFFKLKSSSLKFTCHQFPRIIINSFSNILDFTVLTQFVHRPFLTSSFTRNCCSASDDLSKCILHFEQKWFPHMIQHFTSPW